MKLEVGILGLREFDEALAQLPEALRRNVVLGALKKAARPIVKDARARAPRGTNPAKRGSKKQRRRGDSAAIGPGADSIAARAVRAALAADVAVAVGPDAKHWYLRFAELGTARQAPQRFLTNAFEAHKEAAVAAVGAELWKSLAATAARLAKKAQAGTLSRTQAAALRS